MFGWFNRLLFGSGKKSQAIPIPEPVNPHVLAKRVINVLDDARIVYIMNQQRTFNVVVFDRNIKVIDNTDRILSVIKSDNTILVIDQDRTIIGVTTCP